MNPPFPRSQALDWFSSLFAFILFRSDKYVHNSRPVVHETALLFMTNDPIETAFKKLEAYYNTLFTYAPNLPEYGFFNDSLTALHAAYGACRTDEERAYFKKYFIGCIDALYNLNEILNRMDPLGLAFMLREYEYDFYAEELFQDMEKLNTEKKIYKLLVNRFDIKDRDLNSLGHWGERGSIELEELTDSEEEGELNGEEQPNEEKSEEEDGITIRAITRPAGRRTRLVKRLNWGIKEILKEYARFERRVRLK